MYEYWYDGNCLMLISVYIQTVTNQAIFRVEAAVCRLFRDYLTSQHFVEIHTPKIISGQFKKVINKIYHNFYKKQ